METMTERESLGTAGALDGAAGERADGATPGSPLGSLSAQCAERAAFYRLLSQLYYEPLSQAQVDAMDPDALRDLACVAESPLAAEGYNDMYRALRHRDTGTRQVLNVDFTGAFYGTRTFEGLTAEPYESLYTSAEGRLMGPARTDVHRTFTQAGIKVGEGVDLPDDHLSFELEYLALLCDRCQEALDADDRRQALETLGMQRAFLEEHVLNWFGRFYNLSNRVLQTRFYRGVNKVARSFLEGERATIEQADRALR